jgi:hypothetical protein
MITFISFIGCKNEKKEWLQIQSTFNKDEIEKFINDYPQSIYLQEAQELLSYCKLFKDTTISNYKQFILKYPESKRKYAIEKQLYELLADSALKIAVKVDSIGPYNQFLKIYPNSKQIPIVKEKIRNLLTENLIPDWVFIVDGTIRNRQQPVGKQDLGGIWYGEHSSFRIAQDMSLEFVIPNPKEQKIVLGIFFNEGLPKGLENNKAYLWLGDNDFIFIKDIQKNSDEEATLLQLGLKNHGVPHPTIIPFKNSDK